MVTLYGDPLTEKSKEYTKGVRIGRDEGKKTIVIVPHAEAVCI
jgi:hypothetical protein